MNADTFWSRVDKTNTCWFWTGSIDSEGYGRASSTAAHRFAYRLVVGEIPTGFHLDHLCHTHDLDCPGGPTCLHRRCVRPDHLEAVTNVVNGVRRARVRRHGPWPQALTELLDPQDVADLLGVQVGTVHQWVRRRVICPPARRFGSCPAWWRSDVYQWARETGRTV